MKILVTGTAGFIGFHLAKRLIREGHTVIGLDSINDYYDVNLKYGRLSDSGIERDKIEYNKPVQATGDIPYRFIRLNLEDRENLNLLFQKRSSTRYAILPHRPGSVTASPIPMPTLTAT